MEGRMKVEGDMGHLFRIEKAFPGRQNFEDQTWLA